MNFTSTTSSRRHKLPVALLICIAFSAIALQVQAQLPVAGTITRMRITRMRSEFESHPASYCQKVRNGVKPYVEAVARAIADTARYNQRRDSLINSLKQKEKLCKSPEEKWEIGRQLFDQFANLNFEIAYTQALQCEKWAQAAGNRDHVAESQIMQACAFTSGGYFRESSETLNGISLDGCSSDVRIKYVMARFNMEFENGFYIPYRYLSRNTYLEHMQQCYTEMQQLVSADSYLLDDMRVKMCFHNCKYQEAVDHSKVLLAKLPKGSPYYGYALGNMGYNYMGLAEYVEAAECISKSAEMGIQDGSLIYPAMRKIAEVAYIMGDITHSYQMINVAILNADLSHSRYRYAEIAASYPKIDKDMYAVTQQQKAWLTVGLAVLLATTLVLIAMVVVAVRQRKTLHEQKSLIEKQMTKIADKSEKIDKINSQLLEAGHIKEVVLGQLIVGSANHQAAIKKLRREVLRRLTIKDYEGVRNAFDTQHNEAFDTFYELDQILLMLFPHFADDFNALMRPECQIAVKHGERLTTEMRIFALIRLGITKNDDLAQSLNYSVNTIKSYKTRVIASSLYEKDEFYRRLNEQVSTGKSEQNLSKQ